MKVELLVEYQPINTILADSDKKKLSSVVAVDMESLVLRWGGVNTVARFFPFSRVTGKQTIKVSAIVDDEDNSVLHWMQDLFKKLHGQVTLHKVSVSFDRG